MTVWDAYALIGCVTVLRWCWRVHKALWPLILWSRQQERERKATTS